MSLVISISYIKLSACVSDGHYIGARDIEMSETIKEGDIALMILLEIRTYYI